jgi:proteic killer suppression protein
VIISFADEETRKIFDGKHSRRYSALQRGMERKLRMLNRARTLDDLLEPPGNRLEKLRGDRAGQCRIRVNDQFRVCFEWRDNNAYAVQIVDYH